MKKRKAAIPKIERKSSRTGQVHLGFTLSAEEFPPVDLVRIAVQAEAAGFEYALVSDHFHPWTDSQGHSPFVWVVIGAVAQATRSLRLGTGVTCPTIRIHPAIIAQAAATSAAIMPGRFFLGVGAGEFLNEHVTGRRWPPYSVRLEMLKESVTVIRRLWSGKLSTFQGRHFRVENARIYTLPDSPPPIYVAASGPKSARAAREIGDGLIATSPNQDLVSEFGKGDRELKPRYGQVTVCWDENEKRARETALKIWPIAGMPGPLKSELALPSYFEAAASLVDEAAIDQGIVCGPDPERHIEEIRKYVNAGFDHVYIHQVGPKQEQCIRFYEREILPYFEQRRAA